MAAATEAVAFTLEAPSLHLLARIQLPLAVLQAEAGGAAADEGQDAPAATALRPQPLPAAFAQRNQALAAVRALSGPALPFAAYPLGEEQLQIVCLKAHVAPVFKELRAKQASLGVVVREVKTQVKLTPMPAEELEQACACGLLASLLPCGWWQLGEHQLLSTDLLVPSPTGQPQLCSSLVLDVRVHAPNKITLLVKAEQLQFRHPACKPNTDLAAASARMAGDFCTLLPDQCPGIIQRLRPVDEAALQRLRPLWASYFLPLPADVGHLVDVCLSDDPDDPIFTYPPCCVLGRDGLHSVAAKLQAPAVQATLAKLRDDLAATPFKFLGSLKVSAKAHVWYPDGQPPSRAQLSRAAEAPQPLLFMTAREMQEQVAQQTQQQQQQEDQHLLALGRELDVASFDSGEAAPAAVAGPNGAPQRQKRPHAVADSKLRQYMEQMKAEQAEAENTAAPTAKPAALPASSAAPSILAATASKQPLALRQASAAAAGSIQKPTVPQFKKVGADKPVTAPKKAAAVQKRTAAPKPPAAAKKAKAAPAAAGSAQPVPGIPYSSAAAAAASAADPGSAGQAGPAMPGSTAAGDSVAAAAAAQTKAPAKPRAKAADIDVVAVTSKVQQMHAAGTLGKLTIPELKAYLKSIKQPVGGKKGELEERVRQSLGAVAAPPPAEP